jgi:predicted RNA methylase
VSGRRAKALRKAIREVAEEVDMDLLLASNVRADLAARRRADRVEQIVRGVAPDVRRYVGRRLRSELNRRERARRRDAVRLGGAR